MLVDHPHEGTPTGLWIALGLLALSLLAALAALALRNSERFAGPRHAGRGGLPRGRHVGRLPRLGAGRALMRDQLPWWIGGPVLGLCVVAIRWLLNARLGVTGAFSEVIDRVGKRSLRIDWRGWFFVGLVARRVRVRARRGGPGFDGYGWLTRRSRATRRCLIAVILLGAGVLIGFGAKTAGGCTSGNGLTGTSMFSRAAWAATATFFGTAIVVSLRDPGGHVMRAAGLVVGLVFGVTLSWTGMSDPDVIQGGAPVPGGLPVPVLRLRRARRDDGRVAAAAPAGARC